MNLKNKKEKKRLSKNLGTMRTKTICFKNRYGIFFRGKNPCVTKGKKKKIETGENKQTKKNEIVGF